MPFQSFILFKSLFAKFTHKRSFVSMHSDVSLKVCGPYELFNAVRALVLLRHLSSSKKQIGLKEVTVLKYSRNCRKYHFCLGRIQKKGGGTIQVLKKKDKKNLQKDKYDTGFDKVSFCFRAFIVFLFLMMEKKKKKLAE